MPATGCPGTRGALMPLAAQLVCMRSWTVLRRIVGGARLEEVLGLRSSLIRVCWRLLYTLSFKGELTSAIRRRVLARTKPGIWSKVFLCLGARASESGRAGVGTGVGGAA
jgi:hypothetical protein